MRQITLLLPIALLMVSATAIPAAAQPFLEVGLNQEPNGTVAPGAQDRVIGTWTVTARNGNFPVEYIIFAAEGTGADDVDVTNIEWRLNGVVLNNTQYDEDNDPDAMIDGFLQQAPQDIAQNLVALYDFEADIPPGQTFGLILSEIGGEGPGGALMWEGLLDSATLTIADTVDVVISSDSNPADSQVPTGATDVIIGVWDIDAMGDDVVVNSMTLEASGTGHDADHVTNVRIIRDLNGDGMLNGGEPAVAEFTWEIDNEPNVLVTPEQGGGPLIASNGVTLRLLVVYDFAEDAPAGLNFQVTWTDVTLTPQTVEFLDSMGIPVATAVFTIVLPPGVLTFNANNPGDREVTLGTTQVMCAFSMIVAEVTLEVESITIRATGSGKDHTDITAVRLIRDNNLDGLHTPLTDTVLDVQTYAENNGEIVFDPSALPGTPLMAPDGVAVGIVIEVSFSSTISDLPIFGLQVIDCEADNAPLANIPLISSALTMLGQLDPPDQATVAQLGGGFCTAAAAGASASSSVPAGLLLVWATFSAMVLVRRRG